MNELGPKARALLDATQFADEPSQDDYDRVHRSVAARVAVGVAVGVAVSTVARTAAAAAAPTAANVAAATAPAAAVVGTTAASVSIAAPAAVGATLSTGVVSTLPVVKVVAWVLAASMTAGVGTGVVVASRDHTSNRAPVAAVTATSTSVAPSLSARPPSRAGVVSVPTLQTSGEPATLATAMSSALPPPTQPTSVATTINPPPPTRKETAALSPVASAASLEAEMAIIRDARAALNRDPARALALLDDHARRFPDGAMAQDRDALQVFATCAAGQADVARELAARFLASHAASPYATSVRISCTGQK